MTLTRKNHTGLEPESDQPVERIDLKALEAMGWEFMQNGPNEWQWMKFDNDGACVAVQGDQTWAQDVRSIN